MVEKKKTKRDRIPEFASREEEAAFWDTHSTTDYEDEFKPVRVHVSKKLSEVLPIRLDSATLEELKSVASEKGVKTGTLIRMWVIERLKTENHPTH